MTEERIITAAVVTSGEKHDGKQLPTLVKKSQDAGIEIKNIIGECSFFREGQYNFCEKK